MRALAFLALLMAIRPALADVPRTIAVVGTGSCEDPLLPGHVRAVRDALNRASLSPALRNQLQLLVRSGVQVELRAPTGSVVLSEEQTVAPLGGLTRGSLAAARLALYEAETDSTSAAPMPIEQYVRRDQRVREKLQRAVAMLLSMPPSAERSRTLLKAHTLAIQLYSAMNRRAELEETLEAIFRAQPGLELDPRSFSLVQLAQFEEVRERVRARSTAVLRITSQPPGLPVEVDGFAVGVAPLNLTVPPGRYRVEATAGARRGMAREVTVGDWAEVALEGDMERAVELDAGPCVAGSSAEERASRLGRLAPLIGADLLIAVRSEESPAQQTYLAVEAAGPAARPRVQSVALKLVRGRPAPGGLDQLWDALGPSEERGATPASSVLAPIPPPRPRPPPWMRPGAYAVGGVTLGLAGLALYEGLSSRSSSQKADGLRQANGSVPTSDLAAYDRHRREADSASRAMYLSAGSALVAAGVAGVLWYLSREPEPFVVHF
jgi:hypothetical protein